MLVYIKIFIDSSDELEFLTDEEAGSLLKNLLNYGKFRQTRGEFFEPNFVGNEKIVFPTFKKQIAREFDTYEKKCNIKEQKKLKEASEKESLVKSAQDDSEKNARQRQGQRQKDKEKDYDKDNDNDQEKKNHPVKGGVVDVVVVDEKKEVNVIPYYLGRVNSDPSSEVIKKLVEYEKVIGKDLVLKAIDIGVDNGRKEFKYMRGIMRNFKNWGLDSLEAWERHELERKGSIGTQKSQNNQKPPNGARKTSERTTSYKTDDDLDLLWKNVQESKAEEEPLKS